MTTTNYNNDFQDIEEKKEEWSYIENCVMLYKSQFDDNATAKDITIAQNAAVELVKKFDPLFKKYSLLLKTGQIDFKDPDVKVFVGTFISDPRLHRALKRTKSKAEYRADIYKRFCFVLETYGQLSEQDILIDLQMLLLTLAKRYKQTGKNFCAYVHNCFRYEVSRHIKHFIKNPLNISYKLVSYEDKDHGLDDEELYSVYEDKYYEPDTGIPNMSWISGETCSDIFFMLSQLERKIIVKYYMEEFNDKQIANILGLHINTINQKRRQAVAKVAKELNIDLNNVKRNRNSGKRSIL